MLVLAALLTVHATLAGSIPSAPENITVTFLNPTSVRVSWQTVTDLNINPADKFDVIYRPTDASFRVVAVVAGNSDSHVLQGLQPDTQYHLIVAAVINGKKYRSRGIVFRTLEPPRTSPHKEDLGIPPHDEYGDYPNNSTNRELPTIRGVEVGIVLLVLIVWAGAIALFFNRWGKIRMLLPYQPDYKQEQLKVPGTGVCSSGNCNGQHSHTQPPHFHHCIVEEPSTAIGIENRCTRNRINSAIFVSAEGKGFDSIEFLRRYGSQSVLCRKAKSAENLNSPEKFATGLSRFDQYRTFEAFEITESKLEHELSDDTEPSTSITVPIISPEPKEPTPKLSTLPTLSVSSPSPPHHEEQLL